MSVHPRDEGPVEASVTLLVLMLVSAGFMTLTVIGAATVLGWVLG